VIGIAGALVMALAHSPFEVPVVDALIPAPSIPPLAASFVLGAALFGVVAYGVFTLASWAWWAALVVNGIGFLSSSFPWRGPIGVIPAAVTLLALFVLISPQGRAALKR
jgi:hypothetical protein